MCKKLTNSLDTITKLSYNGNNRSMFSYSSDNKFLDFTIIFSSSVFSDKINLVLNNCNMIYMHDLDNSKMFVSLCAGTSFICSH